MDKDKKTLVLLDAHAIIHRAYHALPDFLSSRGEPTGALYGLASMIMRIATDLKPDYLVACYDLPGKTFRHEAYENYKGKRVKADEALIEQLKNSRQIFEAFGISIYDAPGFEADDVLGTIVEEMKINPPAGGVNIIIASGDMDTMQLVDGERVQVYTLKKGITDTILYDAEKVVKRFGFEPKFLADYKGLRGDPSDNIIGIKGIGEKTATTLIQKFGTIEEIYKELKVKSEKFKEIGLTPRIIDLLKDNEEEALFSKTLAKIRNDAPINFTLPENSFLEGAEVGKIEAMFAKFEFRSLISRLKKLFPGSHLDYLATEPPSVKSEDKNALEEAAIGLWILNSEMTNPAIEDILAFTKASTLGEAREYIFKELQKNNLEKVYLEIEKPIMEAVAEMSETGVLIDKAYFETLSKEYHQELTKIQKEIYKLAGMEFNINSPKQLGEVLFQKLGLKSERKSAGGAPSTRAGVLEELGDSHPIISQILHYRELAKLLSTYIDVIPKMVGQGGRLHAKFLQHGSTTGRFSSQEPNLQNLPIKSELGRRIRRGFIVGPDKVFLAFDYSQIEFRVAAILSEDKKLTQIFRERKDIHAGVASFVFGVPMGEVDSEMRRQAKVINFGIMYGMGVTALRKNLGGTREKAQKYLNNYFREFSGLASYLENQKKFARESGFTETLFGRRRHFPNINSRIPFLRSMAERTVINAPIQGTAADVIKLAIRYAEEDLKKAGLHKTVHLVMQVHDELIYEANKEAREEAERIIKKAMEGVLARSYLKLKTEIPLLVRIGSGKNLGEVK